MSNDAGSVAQTGKRDFDKAKMLIADSGYKGEKIIVLDAVDQPNPHVQALVTADLLKKLGLNVEVAAMDWGSVVTRRASKEPPEKGGWHIFGPGGSAPTCSTPRSTWPCARMARRLGSVGRPTTSSKRCAPNGSQPKHWMSAKNWPP